MNQLSSKTTKSYANETNLLKALKKINLLQFDPIIAKTIEGRWTAICPASRKDKHGISVYPLFIHNGFMAIG